jgi:hypothetical protein
LLKNFGNWCPEIYRSVFLDKFNDDLVQVAPCCQADTVLEPVKDFDFKTSPYLNYLREEFSQGRQPKACDKCWTMECNGHKSRRLSAIEFFKCETPDTHVELQGIDHSATWACNLACIMCGPLSSSTWANQLNTSRDSLSRLGRLFQKNNNIFDQLNLEHVKKIHFNGGEPMLNNDQTELLRKLEQQKVLQDVFISYNTNGTVMPSDQIVDLWSKAKLVKIFYSIDAVESAFDYIRWPAKWSEVADNILTMKQNLPGNVMFGFNCTVGAYNLLEMPKVYDWFKNNIKYNRESDQSDFCWQLATNFDIGKLSKLVKIEAMQRLESIMEFDGLRSIIKSKINQLEDNIWLTTLENLDAKRKTSWRKSLEIARFIEEKNC